MQGQVWPGGPHVRHHLGLPQTAPLVGRRWAWLWVTFTAISSFRSVERFLDGRITAAVWEAILALGSVWLLVLSLRPPQRRAVRLVGFIIVFLATGTLMLVRAAQVSGGDRIVGIVFALILFGFAVLLIVKTVAGASGDPPSVQEDGTDPGASSAESQQEPPRPADTG